MDKKDGKFISQSEYDYSHTVKKMKVIQERNL